MYDTSRIEKKISESNQARKLSRRKLTPRTKIKSQPPPGENEKFGNWRAKQTQQKNENPNHLRSKQRKDVTPLKDKRG